MSATTGNWFKMVSRQQPGSSDKRLCTARSGVAAVFYALVLGIAFGVPGQVNAAEPSAGLFLESKMKSPPPTGARKLCSKYSWACAASSNGARISGKHIEVAKRVNRAINRSTQSVSDIRQYKSEDFWALPTRLGGDCEDFALLKKRELVRLGFPPERLLLATAIDRQVGAHAVLVMRTDKGDYVLDNLRNEILPWASTSYTFVRMQNPASPQNWVGVFAEG